MAGISSPPGPAPSGSRALARGSTTGRGLLLVHGLADAARLERQSLFCLGHRLHLLREGLILNVKAVIAFKVGDDHESISAAARRFQAARGSARSQPSRAAGSCR